MPIINPLAHPVCLTQPLRLAPTAWSAHVPFAMFLIDVLRPDVVVELGTFTGVSYCAFCQAVKELRLPARCFAIDTWQGDEHSSFYGPEIFADLKAHHDPSYGQFSTLIQSTFDAALNQFANATIDLLHIDGYHTYEAVKHDFENWLPKMSDRSVILMHDTIARERDFGVWRLWEEVKGKYPHFEFLHQHGLGVVATGKTVAKELGDLFTLSEVEADVVRDFFEGLGQRYEVALEQDAAARELRAFACEVSARDGAISDLSVRLAQRDNHLGSILSSRAWRWVSRYGRLKKQLTTSARRILQIGSRNGSVTQGQARTYPEWVRNYDMVSDHDRQAIKTRMSQLSYQPLISIVVPPSDTPEDLTRLTIASVRRQLNQNWELCFIDDDRRDTAEPEMLRKISAEDPTIRICPGDEDPAVATNLAVSAATGEFVAFLSRGDELSEHALYILTEELNRFPFVDLIYTDEDSINQSGERSNPQFKTDWNPDLFYSGDYVSHLAVYRMSILRQLGGFRSGFNGSEQYELALRATEQLPEYRIRHIPHILYHRRENSPGSSSASRRIALESSRRALREHFARMGKPANLMDGLQDHHRISYPLPEPRPLVSLIIATRDRADLLRQIVDGVLHETDYDQIELVIVNNQSTQPETLHYLRKINEDPKVTVISYDKPFNFSALNNLGVQSCRGEVLGFLNNDLKVISRDWLREMLSHALRPEIGAVGAKLYYPDDSIQHAGVIVGLGGLAGYVHRRLSRDAQGHNSRVQRVQNYSAVTAACMLVRRSVFQEAGGFDEINLPVAYNDVDLCLRIREKGYRILWTPYAELYHLESASRASDWSAEERSRYERECAYLKSRWASQIAHDRFYNPNLTIGAEDFSLAYPPRTIRPWE